MVNEKSYGGRGDAAFSGTIFAAVFGVVHLLFFSNLGENPIDYGRLYQGKVSYFCSEFLELEDNSLRFTLNGFSDDKLLMLKRKLTVGTMITVLSNNKTYKGRSEVIQICIDDDTVIKYSWWIKNRYAIMWTVLSLLLTPVVFRERRRLIRKYGPKADPSTVSHIKELYRRYQRPYIDDRQTTNESKDDRKSANNE